MRLPEDAIEARLYPSANVRENSATVWFEGKEMPLEEFEKMYREASGIQAFKWTETNLFVEEHAAES